MRDKSASLAMFYSDLSASQNAHVSVLAVGEHAEWNAQGNDLPGDDMVFVSFNEVTSAVLEHYSPLIVVSPALAQGFDCIELAMLLKNIGFTGAYRAVVRDLPRPDLIEREVKQICPLLDFAIVKLD